MNFEDLQKAWQRQDAGAKLTLDADVLLKEVRRNQQQFRATIFWRDVREVGVAYLLTAFFFYRAQRSGDWTDALVGLACLGVGTFMLVDRFLQQRKQTTAKDPLKLCVEASLNQVNHQIWLLRNVFWWYLLPITVAVAISFGHSAWGAGTAGSEVMANALIGALVITLACGGIYWVNQFAVRRSLQPRRQELETLLGSLNENPQ